MSDNVAVIVGAGPGLGSALARTFASHGMKLALARRDGAALAPLVGELGDGARGYACDAAREEDVERLFAQVQAELGRPSLVAFNAGGFVRQGLLDTSVDEFERCWRTACLGGFLVGRAAVRAMLNEGAGAHHRGTIVYTGATASLRGGARFHNLAVGKFGLRALAQSMAREFQPQGIHVAHVVIDGQIAGERAGHSVAERGLDAVLDPHAIAETYWQLHRQPPSAWTLELDLRPYAERF